MQHVQGYSGSHWTPPSGDYSLRITLAAARTANNTTMYYVPTLMAISVVIGGGSEQMPLLCRPL
jgi:hypothetical protein